MDGMNNMSQPPMDVFTASAARGPCQLKIKYETLLSGLTIEKAKYYH